VSRHPEDVLKGKTLRVYWFILKSGRPVRVTDMQSKLQFSSPSLVQYHINKLVEAGLIAEEQAGFVVKRVEIEHFFMLRGVVIPFQVAYVCFFATTLAAMLLILRISASTALTSFDFLAISVNAVALAVSIYETIRTFRTMP
jgi:hypothetical protein